jgi:diguanylate cyclase (GGDEF)-like protein
VAIVKYCQKPSGHWRGRPISRRVNGRRGGSGGSALAIAYASVGLAWTVGHALGLPGAVASSGYVLFALSSIAAIVVGIKRYQPRIKWPFVLFVCSFTIFVAGAAMRDSLHQLGDLTAGRSLLPDALTLPGYIMVGVALLGLARARGGRVSDLDSLLDAALTGLASLAFAWAYLISPALSHQHTPTSVQIVMVCYPALSAFFVAVTMQMISVGGRRRTPAHRLLLLAMSSMVVGDVVYTLVDVHVASVPQRLIDVPYAVAYLALGTCVLHPTMRELCAPLPKSERTPTGMRLLLVSIALGLPVVVTLSKAGALSSERSALFLISLGLTSLAIWRVFRALRAHARSEERLIQQATHDALTGLPNRVFLFERLAQSLSSSVYGDVGVAVLFVDVDRFKNVNDSLGHGFGDELLVAIAGRLVESAGKQRFVGRVGGDEFVLVIEDAASDEAVLHLAESIRKSFRTPFVLRDAEIYSSVSIGVAVSRIDEFQTAESIVRDADTALYQAKAAGRDAVAFFDAEMRDRASRRSRLERDLHRAIERDELVLQYQPVVDVRSRRVVGFEALCRWNHPQLGAVPPLEFIPIAEETGLIVPLGAWVFETAARQLADWRATLVDGADLFMSVNVSSRQLRDPGIVSTLRSLATDAMLPPAALHLELTESLLMDQSTGYAETIRTLRDGGFRISIDDFGTGYSSLSYLRRFPVDDVKIDKSFIDGLEEDDSTELRLVAAIVALGRALGIVTTAEGVESPRQAQRLVELDVDNAQGFVFSRPVAADQVPAVLMRLAQLGSSAAGLCGLASVLTSEETKPSVS